VFGDRDKTGDVGGTLVGIEGVEESAVEHGLESAAQTPEAQGVRGGERRGDSAIGGLFSSQGLGGLGNVDAQNDGSPTRIVRTGA